MPKNNESPTEFISIDNGNCDTSESHNSSFSHSRLITRCNSVSLSINGSSAFASTNTRPVRRHSALYGSRMNQRNGQVQKDGSGKPSSVTNRGSNVLDWNVRRRGSDRSNGESSSRNSSDPPRRARQGMEWVWFPEGYWAERNKVDLCSSSRGSSRDPHRHWFSRAPAQKGSTSSGTEKSIFSFNSHEPSTAITSTARTFSDLSGASKASYGENSLGKLKVGLTYINPTYPHFMSPEGIPEGLYCKTKRNVEGRFVPKSRQVFVQRKENDIFANGVVRWRYQHRAACQACFEDNDDSTRR